jgi:hypothetical protein
VRVYITALECETRSAAVTKLLFWSDLEPLPRRITVAKIAVHSRVLRLHQMDEAGDLWVLMDALNVLDDLLRMNQTDLPRRA